MTSPTEDGRAAYEIACEHDRNGREAEAIPHYERALELGLAPERRRNALVGLGSSLRNVDRHADAIGVLRAAVVQFPDDAALPAFLALALYSAGDARASLATLLDIVIKHAPVGRYARALAEYRNTLP